MYILKFLLLMICFHVLSLQAQDNFTLNGQLIDSTTQVPIPFAHVRLGESISISNQHGNFILNYNESSLNAEVTITCIGYKTRNVSIANLRKSTEIILVPDNTVLNEVVISTLGPQTIFKKAEKNGYKNYKTTRYSADYTLDQWIFYENTDSLIAVSKESGTLLNKGLDTTRIYPKFGSLSRKMSAQFLKYDTLPNPLTFLSKKGNTVSRDFLYSHDPVRIGILKQFHAVPTIFSKGFYANTIQQIQSIVNLDGSEYYLITVYPKINENVDTTDSSIQESIEIAKYKKTLRELAIQLGRTLSESTLDSIFSKSKAKPLSYLMGFFLVNAKNFGISHALIKRSTFDASGKLYSKHHVAASYIEIGKSYYLQSLDILMKRTAPSYWEKDEMLYYLLSLNLSNFKTKKLTRVTTEKSQVKISEQISSEIQAQFKLGNIRQFLVPIKNCADCKTNPMKYFNRSF